MPETVHLKTIDNVKKVSQTNYDSPTLFLQVKVFIYDVIQDQAKVVTAYTKEMKLTLTKLEKIGYKWKRGHGQLRLSWPYHYIKLLMYSVCRLNILSKVTQTLTSF